MRLYGNTNEVPFLKDALEYYIEVNSAPIIKDRCADLLERVKLCEELQKSEKRAKREESKLILNSLYGSECYIDTDSVSDNN